MTFDRRLPTSDADLDVGISTILQRPAFSSRLSSNYTRVWESRELLRSLVERNLKVKYKRSVLGFVWTLFHPLLLVGVYVLVFNSVLRAGDGTPNYWAYLLSGLFVFQFFSASVSQAAHVLTAHAGMARNVPFPSETPIIASVLSRLVEFGLELLIVITVISIFHHHGLTPSLALLPILILILLLCTMGIVFPIAVMSAFYADVEHALPIALRALFFLSPIFYSLDMVPEAAQRIFLLNPMAHLLALFQVTIYQGNVPPVTTLAAALLIAVCACLAGYAVFNHYKPAFVDIL